VYHRLCSLALVLAVGTYWSLPLLAQETNSPFSVTPAEKSLALSLTKKGFKQLALGTTGPMYLTNLELVNDKNAEERGSKDRFALVTYYRYEGDQAILSYINLSHPQLLWQKIKPHLPTQLAPEEFQQMKALILASPEVQARLGTIFDKLEIEAMLIHPTRPQDALYGHRVVRPLFRFGQDYLDEPFVQVDLTTQQVAIITPEQLQQNHHHH
jgi:hypothetical protein